jgi:hypothetical protein
MMANRYSQLERTLTTAGPAAAIDRLIADLRERREYGPLFYAHLMKARHALGVSPIPTQPANELPEQHHAAYEEAIRHAAQTVGNLFLDSGDIPSAWNYFRLINDPEPVRAALEKIALDDNTEIYPLIDVAFHQGVHPRRGFEIVLDRQGICSAITLVGSFEAAMTPDVRVHCVSRLVRALHDQLHERLRGIISDSEGSSPEADVSLDQLTAGRDWLFEGDAWHIDQSHLNAVVQLSVHLPRGPELDLARALCRYGVKLPASLRGTGEPPFDDVYRDYGIFLDVLAGENVDAGLAHFDAKAQAADPERTTAPAEALVTLLLASGRESEALAAARRHLIRADERQLRCPGPQELSRRLGEFEAFADVARIRGDAVQFLAGLLASTKEPAAQARE